MNYRTRSRWGVEGVLSSHVGLQLYVGITYPGVTFDGIFENPIERGGFRGVCNGISA